MANYRINSAITAGVLVLSLLLPNFLFAQPQLTFRPVGEHRGLDAAMPVDLLVDSRGYLWVGSREGLFHYDGYTATRYEPDINDPHAITDLDIRALYEDSDGVIWVATNTGGLNGFDPRTGEFHHYRHRADDPATISHDSVYGMTEGPAGDLWAGTQIGLSRLDRETGLVTRYLHDAGDPDSLSHDYVFTVYLDHQNVLWVATIGGGLNRYNSATDTFTRFDLADMTGAGATRNDVFAIVEDAAQNLWIGTRDGLLRLDASRTLFEAVNLAYEDGAQPVITELLLGKGGVLWAGTLSSGVIRLETPNGDWHAYTDYSESEPGGLAAQPQLSLAMIEDLLFVGNWGGGLWSARIPDADYELHGREGHLAGLRNRTITAIIPGDRMGQAIVGSFGGGVQLFDHEAAIFEELPRDDAEVRRSGVLAIARGIQGHLFLGTTEGLIEIDVDGTGLATHIYDPADTAGIGEGYVTSLLPRPDGSLWVGVGGSGLYHFDPASEAFQPFRHDASDRTSLSGNYITSLLEDGDDFLWVGTRSNGVNLCRISNWSCRHIGSHAESTPRLGHFHVTALHRDKRGRIWIATDGGGLHELRHENESISAFRRWGEADGLLSNSVVGIEEDDDGSLWLSTRHGLTRLDPDQGRVINAVTQSGLPVGHFNSNASGSDAGYIYFGSVDGVLVIPRGRPFRIRAPSPVRITGVEEIGKEFARPVSGWVPPVYTAGYRDMLAINFATLDYSETPHEYAFKLDAEEDWTSLGRRTEVAFLNLAPGTYRFVARGRDIFGQWGESPPLQIEVIPPFWMSLWFRMLAAIFVIASAVLAFRLRTRRLQRRADEIERLGELREQALEQALGTPSELSGLTPRQKEVLQLIAEGHSTREIAERLNVSIKTVETHRANLMERLEIRDVAGLVRLAIRARLISPHD